MRVAAAARITLRMNIKTLTLRATVLLLAATMVYRANAIDKGPIDPLKMTDPELLAQVRQLTEEKFELSRFAVEKATTDTVKLFAQRILQHGQEVDTRLNDLAATGNLSAADKDNLATPDEVTQVERMQGAAINSGYVKAMLHLSTSLAPLYDQLATRGGTARLKEFAREALSSERASSDQGPADAGRAVKTGRSPRRYQIR